MGTGDPAYSPTGLIPSVGAISASSGAVPDLASCRFGYLRSLLPILLRHFLEWVGLLPTPRLRSPISALSSHGPNCNGCPGIFHTNKCGPHPCAVCIRRLPRNGRAARTGHPADEHSRQHFVYWLQRPRLTVDIVGFMAPREGISYPRGIAVGCRHPRPRKMTAAARKVAAEFWTSSSTMGAVKLSQRRGESRNRTVSTNHCPLFI